MMLEEAPLGETASLDHSSDRVAALPIYFRASGMLIRVV